MQPRSSGIGISTYWIHHQTFGNPIGRQTHSTSAGTKQDGIICRRRKCFFKPCNSHPPTRTDRWVINLRTNNNYQLTNDDTEIAEAVAERLSLAIESATLLQSTQHRADIERVTTDISSKISSSTRFETILQTAAQELSKALGGSDVLVQIEPIASKMISAQ